MKRQTETWLLVVIATILIAGVVAIYLTLPDEKTPRAEFLIESGKILAGGVIVGILGVWAKQALERAAERKQQLEAQRAAHRVLFESLQTAIREALRDLRDLKLSSVPRFDSLFFGERMDFESLLDQWEVIEPGEPGGPESPPRKVKSSYQVLEAEFNKVGLTKGFRDKAEKEILKWSKYITPRVLGL